MLAYLSSTFVLRSLITAVNIILDQNVATDTVRILIRCNNSNVCKVRIFVKVF